MGATAASLQAAFTLYNSRAGIAIFVVGAGIIGEVAVLLMFSQEMTRKEKIALLITNVVILVGCGGEWWYGRQAAAVAGELQIKASVKIATLGRETAALRKSAAVFNKEAADARLIASNVQLTLAELEAPRTVTPRQQRIIVAALRNAPKGPVSVVSAITDDTDAKVFSASIKQTLIRAGYSVVPAQGRLHSVLSWSAPGAYLVVHDVNRAPPYAGLIQHAFGRAGIWLIGVGKPTYVGPTQVVIVVSSHPFYVQHVPKVLRTAP
jgi:hypothetical protein